MNNRKICVIICSNNRMYLEECTLYLNRLIVPEGYELNLLVIEDATSMCAGYNEAMGATDAAIKIYMHQDTFITDIHFLQEIVDIFKLDRNIGMIGIAGVPRMPEDGVMWHAERVFAQYYRDNCDIAKCTEYISVMPQMLRDVDAVDGFLMVTSVDIPWRQDIFDGWDFYDASMSYEMRAKGYRVVVPVLGKPVCVHDDGMILNLDSYDKYRERFLKEYASK